MKRLKQLFLMAFCLPLGILGAVAPQDEPDAEEKPKDKPPSGDTPPKDGGVEGLPKTQEELNALIEARLARERRKPKQTAQPPTQSPAAQPTAEPPTQESPELQSVSRELMLARAQLEAVRSGIDPNVAEDAVYLAMREAEKADALDNEGIRAALQTVLKRHPEWKKEDKEKKPGFKVGAETDKTSAGATRALPTGKVVF